MFLQIVMEINLHTFLTINSKSSQITFYFLISHFLSAKKTLKVFLRRQFGKIKRNLRDIMKLCQHNSV